MIARKRGRNRGRERGRKTVVTGREDTRIHNRTQDADMGTQHPVATHTSQLDSLPTPLTPPRKIFCKPLAVRRFRRSSRRPRLRPWMMAAVPTDARGWRTRTPLLCNVPGVGVRAGVRQWARGCAWELEPSRVCKTTLHWVKYIEG